MGCCESDPRSQLANEAGEQLGNSLMEKGKARTDETGTMLLERVESNFDDTVDKMINKKLLQKCDSTFDKAVDTFIDQTFEKALEKINPPRRRRGNLDIQMQEIAHHRQIQLEAERILTEWGLPQFLIDTLHEEGWLDQNNWDVLTKAELKRLNFGNGHIELFMNGMRKRKQEEMDDHLAISTTNVIEEDPIQMLLDWGIPSNLIDKMKEVGWSSPEYWDDLLEHEYELEDIGFKNGHVSTFKRKFQSWKEEQDSKLTERKIQLLRKLEKPAKRQSTCLKRNIDVENATDVEVKVRIIGERKYGSMESKAQSTSQTKNKQSERRKANLSGLKNKTKTEQKEDKEREMTSERSVNLGGSVSTPIPPIGSASFEFGVGKSDGLKVITGAQVLDEQQSESHVSQAQQRSNKDSQSDETASHDTSHHKWHVVDVGFTEIMPGNTLVFPVQIDDPNAVVYMTIYLPEEDRNICENVQIDANFIKIEKVKYTFGTRIKWKHAIKPPKHPVGNHIQQDEDAYEAKKNRTRARVTISEICQFMNERGMSDEMHDFIILTLGGHPTYDIRESSLHSHVKEVYEKDQMIYDIMQTVELHQMRRKDERGYDEETHAEPDIKELLDRFVQIKNRHLAFKLKLHKERATRKRRRRIENQKIQTWKHEDLDSDDEELEMIKKFYPVDGYSLLKKWELEQFYERMVDEGWKNPLDWIHLDDHIMRQNLGFRHGHISIFNRKFDLWVKKYNEIRKTIPPRRRGKDGILIVGPGETKVLKSNYNYVFTKIIVRTGGKLTVEPWGPSKKQKRGGVLFIICWNEVVLEKDARIDVTGCGFWGSRRPNKHGFAPLGKRGGGSVGVSENGAGGGGHATPGFAGKVNKTKFQNQSLINAHDNEFAATDEKYYRQESDSNLVTQSKTGSQDGGSDAHVAELDGDQYVGNGGQCYGNAKISALDVDFRTDFNSDYTAKPTAVTKHIWALGGGGGFHPVSDEQIKQYESEWTYPMTTRGGTGGGAVKILCDRLWMHQGASIQSNGFFDRNGFNLSGGGAGGSLFIRVWTELWTYNEELGYEEMGVQSPCFRAMGGGMYSWNKHGAKKIEMDVDDKWQTKKGEVGVGGMGRIRIDYHSVYSVSFSKCRPKPVIGNASPDEDHTTLQQQEDAMEADLHRKDTNRKRTERAKSPSVNGSTKM
eukprot:264987_1